MRFKNLPGMQCPTESCLELLAFSFANVTSASLAGAISLNNANHISKNFTRGTLECVHCLWLMSWRQETIEQK